MKPRLIFALLLFVFCASTSWSKMKKEEQEYLDEEVQKVMAQVSALRTQVDTLSKQLADLQKKQGDFNELINRQQDFLGDLHRDNELMSIDHKTNLGNITTELHLLRDEEEKAFSRLTSQLTPAPAPIAAATSTPPPTSGSLASPTGVTTADRSSDVHYVTFVQGDTLTLDMGSEEGLRPGSRLGVYKASNPALRIGVIEVTDVVDAKNSHAKIVSMNTGVRPDFSDLVRPE